MKSKKLTEKKMVNIYPLSNYSFFESEARFDNYCPVPEFLPQRELSYTREGMRTNVEAIILVHEDNRPHILLLQAGAMSYYLPGGRLKPEKDEIAVLKRKLSNKLGANIGPRQPNWQIGECVGIWWRSNYIESKMYPYCPSHVAKPRECTKLFLVHLSESNYFGIPKNMNLISVPLSELYEDAQSYGPVISSIPVHLSRFQLNII